MLEPRGAAVEEIYDDLQNHIESVRSIPSDRRSALAKQVQGMCDVCAMAGVFCSHSSDCIDLIRQAADWSISFAAGSDARKSAFLKDVSQGKDREFLRDVLNAYHSSSEKADLRGSCGYSIGSGEYRSYMERKVFAQDLPAMSSDDYDGALRDALANIAQQLRRDLARNERENTS